MTCRFFTEKPVEDAHSDASFRKASIWETIEDMNKVLPSPVELALLRSRSAYIPAAA